MQVAGCALVRKAMLCTAALSSSICLDCRCWATKCSSYCALWMNPNDPFVDKFETLLARVAGLRFGPPGARRLVYFVDDMNMPFVDKYDTQSAIELIRQHVDYRGWFDKVKIVLKEVTNTQYAACMNPTAGSFHITPRMQRHFATFAVQMPGAELVR